MTIIGHYFDALLMMLAEMSPYLMLGFFIAGLLRTFVPHALYSNHLSKRNMKSVVKAAAIGIPLPLCSCGVIPTSVSLRKEGASHGACTSFLIATPQTGVDSIAATYSMMGLPFAIVRPLAALFTAMFGGWLVNRYAKDDDRLSAAYANQEHHEHCHCQDHNEAHEHADDDECDDENHECHCGETQCHEDGNDCGCGCCHHSKVNSDTFWGKLKGALAYGFVDMLQDVGKWLVVGLLIAALITVAVPNEWLAALHEYKLLNMLIVLAIAIPMYVCATGSIPIAVSLMAKGLTPGAALVLLMAGPAVNSASILVIGNSFGKRTLSLYILSIVIGSIAFGLCIDYLLPQDWFSVSGVLADDCCMHHLTFWNWLFIVVFVALLLNAFVLQAMSSHKLQLAHHHDSGISVSSEQNTINTKNDKDMTRTYKIDGMSCNHCKASAEKAISNVDGVEKVEVDLAKGIAYVEGNQKDSDVIAAIEEAGFNCRLL